MYCKRSAIGLIIEHTHKDLTLADLSFQRCCEIPYIGQSITSQTDFSLSDTENAHAGMLASTILSANCRNAGALWPARIHVLRIPS